MQDQPRAYAATCRHWCLFSKFFMLTNEQGIRVMDSVRSIASGFSWLVVLVFTVVFIWNSAVELASRSPSAQKRDLISVRKSCAHEPGKDAHLDPPAPPLIKHRKQYQQQVVSIEHSVLYHRTRQPKRRVLSPPCFDPCDF